ncbi:MAG: hypothetical protein CBC24_02900 [Candidatus Pelagibacter sp. TMED64]|nr:MAG: hypothetical protein CBC24_02900 [Candidatus Pelagibacter sp. TMED64]
MYYRQQSIYDAAGGGSYTNVKTAFDVGYEAATEGKGSDNPTMSVKNFYEQRLSKYLKKLPSDVDLSQIPTKYRGNISDFLSQQKQEYVNAANSVDEYEVGSQDYMDRVAKMNQIKSSFENLDKQMKLYGENKKELIEDIEGQTTSLYGENQANINLLTSVYNEELDMMIDETGNVKFIGVDGELSLNDMPDYAIKDYETASAMTKMGVGVYQNALKTGQVLNQNNPLYFQYQNQLKTAIDQGGTSTLMSILHDGLVGNVVLADGMKDQIQAYKDGNLSFAELRDQVVDSYMGVLVKQSQTGASQRKVNPSNSGGNKDVTFKKDQAAYNYYKKYLDTNKVPPLPAGFQVRPETDAGGNKLDEPTGKMEIVGPKGTLLYDPNEGLDPNLFYQFMGLDHRVWAGDIVVDDVNTEFSE